MQRSGVTINAAIPPECEGKYPQPAALFEQRMVSQSCKDFLTLEAYRFLE